MVYGYYGVNVGEQELNKRVKTLTLDKQNTYSKATERECLIALAQKPGWHEEFSKAMSHILNSRNSNTKMTVDPGALIWDALEAKSLVRDTDSLIKAFLEKEPAVIVCSVGQWTKEEHAMVVTRINIGRLGPDPKSYAIVSVDVLDPLDPTGQTTCKSSEYLAANFKAVYTKSIAEKILKDELEAFKIQSN